VRWFVALHGTRHASCCRGLHPADAELRYLDHVRRLDTYGVDMHCATVRVRHGRDECVCVLHCNMAHSLCMRYPCAHCTVRVFFSLAASLTNSYCRYCTLHIRCMLGLIDGCFGLLNLLMHSLKTI
jgi:hypothetical protein